MHPSWGSVSQDQADGMEGVRLSLARHRRAEAQPRSADAVLRSGRSRRRKSCEMPPAA